MIGQRVQSVGGNHGTVTELNPVMGDYKIKWDEGYTTWEALKDLTYLPIGTQQVNEEVAPPPAVEKKKSEGERLIEFFFPKTASRTDYWGDKAKLEGLCPVCHEKGRYHYSVPVCSTHGPY